MDIAKYWKTIVDTLQDGLMVVDPRGTIIAANPAAEQEDPECHSYIDNAINMMQPERMGISSTLTGALSLLNEWAGMCGKFDSEPPTLKDSQRTFLKKYLSEEQLAKLELTRFTEIDGKFIRDSVKRSNILIKQKNIFTRSRYGLKIIAV